MTLLSVIQKYFSKKAEERKKKVLIDNGMDEICKMVRTQLKVMDRYNEDDEMSFKYTVDVLCHIEDCDIVNQPTFEHVICNAAFRLIDYYLEHDKDAHMLYLKFTSVITPLLNVPYDRKLCFHDDYVDLVTLVSKKRGEYYAIVRKKLDLMTEEEVAIADRVTQLTLQKSRSQGS